MDDHKDVGVDDDGEDDHKDVDDDDDDEDVGDENEIRKVG